MSKDEVLELLGEALESAGQAAAAGWYPARRRLLARLGASLRDGLPVWVPEADVEEGHRDFVVSVDLPGVEKEDIRILVQGDILTISGRRRDGEERDGRRREQPQGRFLRRLRLPAEVKPEEASALCRNGVLRVILPRLRPAAGRSVKVE